MAFILEFLLVRVCHQDSFSHSLGFAKIIQKLRKQLARKLRISRTNYPTAALSMVLTELKGELELEEFIQY